MDTTRAPFVPPQLLTKLICDYFPLETVQIESIKEFVCYSDRNYYFTGILKPCVDLFTTTGPHTQFVMKFLNYNDSSDLGVVDGLTKMKKYLYRKQFICPYPVPSSLPSKSDNIVIKLTALLNWLQTDTLDNNCVQDIDNFSPFDSDIYYCISVLIFVQGNVCQNKQHSSQLLYEIGHYTGSMDRELMVTEYVLGYKHALKVMLMYSVVCTVKPACL